MSGTQTDEQLVPLNALIGNDQRENLRRIARERQSPVGVVVREAVRHFLAAEAANRNQESIRAAS